MAREEYPEDATPVEQAPYQDMLLQETVQDIEQSLQAFRRAVERQTTDRLRRDFAGRRFAHRYPSDTLSVVEIILAADAKGLCVVALGPQPNNPNELRASVQIPLVELLAKYGDRARLRTEMRGYFSRGRPVKKKGKR